MVTIVGVNLYNIEETAELLGITSRTLQRWTNTERKGRPKHIQSLHFVKAPNGKKLFKEEEIRRVASQCLGVEISVEGLKDLKKLADA